MSGSLTETYTQEFVVPYGATQPELAYRGLTLERYASYAAAAQRLRSTAMTRGRQNIEHSMRALLAEYGQDPQTCTDGQGINIYLCGRVSEWDDAIDQNNTLRTRYHQLLARYLAQPGSC